MAAASKDDSEAFTDADFAFEHADPVIAFDADGPLPPFHDWTLVYPFLGKIDRFREALLEEVKQTTEGWASWPETGLYKEQKSSSDWKVIPLVYTFPSNDPSKTTWVEAECERLPLATKLLRALPGVRTALFSRLGPDTEIAPHTGWAPLANHVLRVHLPLSVPGEGLCGIGVEDETRMHREGEIIVFDDSKTHFAFNKHPSDSRIVLIIDLARPAGLPEGRATGGETKELLEFIASFAAGRE